MKNVPLVLCIISILLTASGGLNVGLSHTIDNVPETVFAMIGILFTLTGFIGMGASFYALIKSTPASCRQEEDITKIR